MAQVTKKNHFDTNSLQIYFFSLKEMLVNKTGVDLQAINPREYCIAVPFDTLLLTPLEQMLVNHLFQN